MILIDAEIDQLVVKNDGVKIEPKLKQAFVDRLEVINLYIKFTGKLREKINSI